MPFYHTIVCVDKKYGIAKTELNKSFIPWYYKDEYLDVKKQDLLFFKKMTVGHTIIMGKNTYNEIGALPGRENIIISSSLLSENSSVENNQIIENNKIIQSIKFFKTPLDAIRYLNNRKYEHIFIIGGEKIYNWFISKKFVSLEFITTINNDFGCDLFYNNKHELKNNQRTLYKKYSLKEFKNISGENNCINNDNNFTNDNNCINNDNNFINNDNNCINNDNFINNDNCINNDNFINNDNCIDNDNCINKIINKLDNILYELDDLDENNNNNKIDEKCRVKVYKNINDEENDVLNTFNFVLMSNEKPDRTGIGTLSSFGHTLYFSLNNNTFPLITTRNIWLKGLFEEFMLYLRGQTNSKILEAKGVNVWKGNTTRDFLDKRGLQHLPEGDMGSSYGFLFRHFGAKYIDCNTDYKGQGFDQLEWLINEIKTNPDSRRLIINLWDPSQINNMALPPCLYQYQFYVNNNTISCMATQRSSDIMTALGWNIAQISLFTILLGSICNLKPKYIIWNGADVHIYNNLIDQAKKQIKRSPYLFPKLYIKNIKKNITDYEFDDLELINYTPHSKIDVIMNV